MTSSTKPNIHQALALVAEAVVNGSLPSLLNGDGKPSWGSDGEPPIARMDTESGEVLGEAALAVAFGAFASRGGDGGPIHTLVASIGLMAMLAGEEPDPPQEIASVLTDGDKVEAEIDLAEVLADEEFRKTRSSDGPIAALEARIVGTAITLAGCTLQDGEDGQEAVRVRAARYLARLSAGLLVMNQALRARPGAGQPDLPSGPGEAELAHSDRHATS